LFERKAKLLSSGFLSSILVLTEFQVVVVISLGLVATAELIELLVTEGRTIEKVAKMAVVAEIAGL
jgi:hypothetical protein